MADEGSGSRKRKKAIRVKFDASATPAPTEKASKRPKIIDSSVPAKNSDDPVEDLLEAVLNQKDRKGRLLSKNFMETPTRKQEPEYHKIIKEKIDLKTIKQRVADGETYDDLVYDLNLMLTNARMFYLPQNSQWNDACELTKLVNTHAMHTTLGDLFVLPRIDWKKLSKGSATASAELKGKMRKLVTKVKDYVKEDDHGDGYLIHEIFLEVPGKKDYPDYFRIVSDPLDILTIEKMVEEGKFPSLAEFVRTFDAMFENAVTYNPPGSEVYEDAIALMKYLREEAFAVNKALRSQLGAKGGSGSLKVSVKRMTPSPGPTSPTELGTMKVSLKRKGRDSGATAAAASADDEREGKRRRDSVTIEMDEIPKYEKPSGIRATLKHVITVMKDADDGRGKGKTMADLFWHLPSEDELPAYYEKIARPIDMKAINGKILGNTFRNTNDFQKAVDQLCSNTMQFFPSGSTEFKAASTLKAICEDEIRKAATLGIPLSEAARQKIAKKSDRMARKIEKDKERRMVADMKSRRSKDKKVTKVDLYLGLLRALKEAEASDGSGRKLATEFLFLPSRVEYPEYYEIIKRPVDLKTIEERIAKHRYASAEDLMRDVNAMFTNAHSFNEEGSSVYQDATELKALAHTHYLRLLELMNLDRGGGPLGGGPPLTPASAAAAAATTIGSGKRRQLKSLKADPSSMSRGLLSALERAAGSDAIFGTQWKANLALFDALPERRDNPAFFRVVTTPIDLATIRSRVDDDVYTKPTHIVLDLVLLFNNARMFFDRDDPVHAAATGCMQALRQAAAQVLTYQDAIAIPALDVSCSLFEAADDLLVSIEASPLAGHFLETPDHKESPQFFSMTPNALTLKALRGKVLAKRYQTLYEFVLDVGSVFADARARSSKKAAIYKDSITVQELFAEALQGLLKERNITSPRCADYTKEHVAEVVAKEEAARPAEMEIEAEPADAEAPAADANGVSYSTGEFVYVKNPSGSRPSICLLTRLFKGDDGTDMFEGVQYLLPEETHHVATRTFYENEVFKTKDTTTDAVVELGGKCWVLFMKEYCANTVAGIDEADLYVCESRYTKNGKKMDKIRNFTVEGVAPELVPRETRLDGRKLPKVKSPHADLAEAESAAAAAAASASSDGAVDGKLVLDDPRNVVQPLELEKGCTYYKTLCLDGEAFSIGDAILLRNPDDRKKALPFVALIKRMWVDEEGNPFCSGPWLARPIETHHDPARSFYENELLLTATSDANPMLSIIRKCALMQVTDFQSWRPLAVADPYVFICESRYNDKKKEIAMMKAYPDDVAEAEERISLSTPAELNKVPSPFAARSSVDPETGTVGPEPAASAAAPAESAAAEQGDGSSQVIQNLKSQIGMTRSALVDTQRKSKKLLDRAVQQAARLAALEHGGDGTEAASIKLASLKHLPSKLDPKNEYVTEHFTKAKAEQPLADDRSVRDKLIKTWNTLQPTDKAPFIQKATRKDGVVAAAYAAAINERDTYQPALAPPKPPPTQQGGDASVAVAQPAMTVVTAVNPVTAAMASTALTAELQRNPHGYSLSQAYESRIAADIKAIKAAKPLIGPVKLSGEEQRELPDATIAAPAVASSAVGDVLESFKIAMEGDNATLQQVFAGW